MNGIITGLHTDKYTNIVQNCTDLSDTIMVPHETSGYSDAITFGY